MGFCTQKEEKQKAYIILTVRDTHDNLQDICQEKDNNIRIKNELISVKMEVGAEGNIKTFLEKNPEIKPVDDILAMSDEQVFAM